MSGQREVEPEVERPPLPDQPARDRIRTDLTTSLLVEAGAGSGKTTELVARMVALVESGTARVQEIAAVTFTRKAAAELRQRFQAALESRLRDASIAKASIAGEAANVVGRANEAANLLGRAIEDIDQAFLGTIHAFCARLLRERPIQAGLDPGFTETLEAEAKLLQDRFWSTFLERLVSEEDPVIDKLADVGIRVHQLRGVFDHMVENLDVDFPAPFAERPGHGEVSRARDQLGDLLDRALELLPPEEPADGWDPAMQRIRSLGFSRDIEGWDNDEVFFEAISQACSTSSRDFTLKRWPSDSVDRVKRLRDELRVLGEDEGPIRELLDRWLAHRYPLVIRVARRAAEEFAKQRRRIGRLSFHDLLTLTVGLLRDDPRVRQDLGERYRFLLVDEFQDTDPIQAEVVFLLCSDSDEAGADWRAVTPRRGALFVVGDPKQSIYRFRRADIAVYNTARGRFADFGAVLLLTANFRSRPRVADLVNEVFDTPERFPSEKTDYQARFAPMIPQPREEPPGEGVFRNSIERGGQWSKVDAEAEAASLASWILRRIDRGERNAGDFLLLTRTKRNLDLYARALEDRNVAIDVSGAGVGSEDEIGELVLLLRALIDPGDRVGVVAVLVGLFFGLDHEQLVAHAEGGGRFDFSWLPDESDTDAGHALATLHEWWIESQREPADVLIGRLVDRLGLLPYAAGGALGTLRTGALVYALDAVRAQTLAGDSSLVGAVEALEAALAWEDAEAPLEPGRSDAVKVMNVHKAKGLEAPVVVLADPGPPRDRAPTQHVVRGPTGTAEGYLTASIREGRGTMPLARPLGWRAFQEEESRFEAAEELRIMYVAATRARDELVVAHRGGKSSAWGVFDDWLARHADVLDDVSVTDPPPRESLTRSADDVLADVSAVDAERDGRAAPTYEFESITGIAKRLEPQSDQVGEPTLEEAPPTPEVRGPADASRPARGARTAARGYEWGSVVHGVLAAAARGGEGEALRFVARSLLVEFERPITDEGEPTELDELMSLVGRVRGSELWRRAERADRRHPEISFAAPQPGADLDGDGIGEGIVGMIEGVIDLAFWEDGGWVIADYKTDVGDDPDFPRRRLAYRRQVDLYGECWEAVTGQRVKEKVLLFTSLEESEIW